MTESSLSVNARPRLRVMQVLTRMNVGGITHQVLLLSDQLRGQGHDVQLVAGRGGAQEGDCRSEAIRRGFQVHEVGRLSNEASPVSDALACLDLYRVFSRERPAVVHLHMFKARVLGSFAARLAGIPVVIQTLHGNVLEGYFNKYLSSLILFTERIVGWWLVHRLIAPTESLAKELLVRYRIVPGRKLLVQRVGFDRTPFEKMDDFKGRLRGKIGVNHQQLLVGVLARLVPIKGIGDFLEATALVVESTRQAGVSFIVVGDGPLRSELENRASALSLNGTCRFLGWIDDVRSFYADVDVVVLSSWNEGTPIGLLEAMAAGKAIVATCVGGVPDMLEDGVSALLVPSRKPQALGEAILKLVLDPGLRARLGHKAKQRVSEFSSSALRDSMHKLYQDLLQEKGVAREEATSQLGRS